MAQEHTVKAFDEDEFLAELNKRIAQEGKFPERVLTKAVERMAPSNDAKSCSGR